MISEATAPSATRTGGAVVAFTVSYAPAIKGRPRVAVRNGRAHAYTPKRTVVAEWQIRQAAMQAMGSRSPLEGPLSLTVTCVLPMPVRIAKKHRDTACPTTRPDLDNYLKITMDGCTPLWHDDAQVVEINVRKIYGLTPRTEISVRSIYPD